MKKILFIMVFLILFTGLVIAARGNTGSDMSNSDNGIQNETGDYDRIQNRTTDQVQNRTNEGIGQNLSQQISNLKEEIKVGNYTGPQGQLLQVREMAQNLRELRVRNYNATTQLRITAENEDGKVKLRTVLNNGEEVEIKVMPDVAAERALERLRIRVCSEENNCTIQLKAVGSGDSERAQYEIQAERHSRILGIFQKKMQVRAEVNAENENVEIKKPWWAFLATEPEE